VAGRHIHYQSLQAAIRYAIESIGHDFVMTALNECGPHFSNERQEVVLSVNPLLGFRQLVQKN
jgi:hypothetical protein